MLNFKQVNDLFGEIGFVVGGESRVSLIAQTDVEMYLSFSFYLALFIYLLFSYFIYYATLFIH